MWTNEPYFYMGDLKPLLKLTVIPASMKNTGKRGNTYTNKGKQGRCGKDLPCRFSLLSHLHFAVIDVTLERIPELQATLPAPLLSQQQDFTISYSCSRIIAGRAHIFYAGMSPWTVSINHNSNGDKGKWKIYICHQVNTHYLQFVQAVMPKTGGEQSDFLSCQAAT